MVQALEFQLFCAWLALGFSIGVASSWFSDSGMPSKFPRGFGKGLSGTVTVAVSRGSSNQHLSYNAPLVSSVIGNLHPSTGSIMVSLFGASIGSFISNRNKCSSLWLCFAHCHWRLVWSRILLSNEQCRIRLGGFVPVVVCVRHSRKKCNGFWCPFAFDRQIGYLAKFLDCSRTYDLAVPLITDRLLPSTGHEFVVAYGTGYGGTSLSLIITIGKSTSEFSVWVSDSTIVSLNSPWLSEPALACGFCIWYGISLTRSLLHDPQYLVRIV